MQGKINVQYGSCIYSVMYVKDVYSTLCHMFDCSDFICNTYVYTSPYKLLKYLADMAYIDKHICL